MRKNPFLHACRFHISRSPRAESIGFRVQSSPHKTIPFFDSLNCNPPFRLQISSTRRFMSQIERDIIPESCFCGNISPRLRSNSFHRSSRYERLPPQLLQLSVLKLDGSSFEVQVARSAKVAELRDAVERVFCQMPMNTDIKISWPHVWSHFCLCYKDYKLINDKAYIKNLGIRDGDQLNFCQESVDLKSPKKEIGGGK